MTIKRMPGVSAGSAEPAKYVAAQATMRGGTALGQAAGTRRILNASDGTNQLLNSGFWIMLVGLVAGALTVFAFGGMGPQGAHTNAGWLSLMVAMMSTPFAILLLLLGGAKWLRNYRLSKAPAGR